LRIAVRTVFCGAASTARHVNGARDRLAEEDGGKYISSMSIKTDSAGNRYVDVDLTTEIQKELQAANTVEEKRDIAYRYIMDNLRNRYPTGDGRMVDVWQVSAKKLTHHAPEVRISAIPELVNIITIGTNPEIKDVTHKRFAKFAYYDVLLKVGDTCYTAVMNIGIRKNGESVLYDINQFEEKAVTSDIGKLRRSAPAEETAERPNTNNIGDSG
jgi:hypothetical protein